MFLLNRIPLVVGVDVLPDGSLIPRSFIWPNSGKRYSIDLVYGLFPSVDSSVDLVFYLCRSYNRKITMVLENGLWFLCREDVTLEFPVKKYNEIYPSVYDADYGESSDEVSLFEGGSLFKKDFSDSPASSSVRDLGIMLEKKFCYRNWQLDYSFGGNIDLCNFNVIRPRLVAFHTEQGYEEVPVFVKFVSDFFRDRRYDVLERIFCGNPLISPYFLKEMTGFSEKMCDKFVKRKRGIAY